MKNFFIPNRNNNYKPYLLSKIALTIYSILLILVNSFAGILGIAEVNASSISSDNIIYLTNQERKASGLNTLNNNAKLQAAALAKANNMFEEQYWDHFGPNGESPWQFIRASGYEYVYAGENLAKGFKTAEGVHEAWMASPTHAANVVSQNYKDIGVAVVEGELLGKQTILVVQMFGNLTEEVVKSNTTSGSEDNVVVGNEQGDIKSISITSPANSSTITTPDTPIQGEVGNVQGEYTVNVEENSKIIGSTVTEGNKWEVNKGSDWSEGDHSVTAILGDNEAKSETVTFKIDSKPPTIEEKSISVSKTDDKYNLFFTITNDWKEIKIVSGSEEISLEYNNNTEIQMEIQKTFVKEKVTLIAADENGNTTEIDITEHFKEEQKTDFFTMLLSLVRSDIRRVLSIAIVSFVFILLCIEVIVYWKKGKLKEAVGELFTIGSWWLILTIATFGSFSGNVS